VDAFMCYKQKCKVVSLNLAHPVHMFAKRPLMSHCCRQVFWAGEGRRYVLRLRSTLLVRELIRWVWAVLLRRLWRQRQQVRVNRRVWGRVYDIDDNY